MPVKNLLLKLKRRHHTGNPRTWGGEGRKNSKFKANLVYTGNSRLASQDYIQRYCLENKIKK